MTEESAVNLQQPRTCVSSGKGGNKKTPSFVVTSSSATDSSQLIFKDFNVFRNIGPASVSGTRRILL